MKRMLSVIAALAVFAVPAVAQDNPMSFFITSVGSGDGANLGGLEVHQGEWTNDPPDRHDPCGDCGNYRSRWAPPFLLARWRSLWGYRRCRTYSRTYKGSCCNSCGEQMVYSGPVQKVYSGPVQKEFEIVPAPKTNTRTRVIESKSAVQNPSGQYYRSRQGGGRSVVY